MIESNQSQVLCVCGCGGVVKTLGCKFFPGHNRRGKRRSQEAIDRTAKALRGRKVSEEIRMKNRLGHLGMKLTQETRIRMSLAQKQRYVLHPELIAKKSEQWKQYWASLSDENRIALRKRISDAAKVLTANPLVCQRLSNQVKSWYSIPENRQKRCGRPCPSETREKIRKAHIGMLHSAETRARLSEIMIQKCASGEPVTSGPSYSTKGWFWSEKNKAKLWFASSYEKAAFGILELLSKVSRFTRCPDWITYQDEKGFTHRYNPDILVTYTDNTQEIIEVKPEYMLTDPLVIRKVAAAKEAFGKRFSVWTESQLGIKLA